MVGQAEHNEAQQFDFVSLRCANPVYILTFTTTFFDRGFI